MKAVLVKPIKGGKKSKRTKQLLKKQLTSWLAGEHDIC